ncbi:hypothetical protein SAMN05421676_102347 [Salinibacillus kushneri]|uniref:Uncharacterized protein n=1 Tax=Salinibacillus kushneri TaxID=237682 RepID=A0A1I0B4C1_9BACI|nr:hypothetical protein [Salinibacillus kushneri]SET01570.1 hypothetical protein SAMN05421676_102347 [Salinibacillus kushneri]
MSHQWLRAEYLKNSILGYNSIEDYTYQIIWFAFDIHGEHIRSQEDYNRILKLCNYRNLNKMLEKNKEAKELKDIIDTYRFSNEIIYLRDTLANNLKHRGNLRFYGLERPKAGYGEKNELGELVFDSKWIQPVTVDIDETITKLANIHKKALKFVNDVINYIDFFNQFDQEALEDGDLKPTFTKFHKKLNFYK